MSPALTRRGLVQTAGAAIGATVAGMPFAARAAVRDPDSALLALIARHAAVVAERNALQDPLEKAEARFEAAKPPRPAALTETFGDVVVLGGSTGRDTHPNGRPWCYFTSGDVARLRARGAVTSPAWDEDGLPLPPVPNPQAETRRHEIVAAYDAWEAEKQALADRIGLTAVTAEDDRLYEIVWDLRDTIRDTAPATLAGFGAKAQWAMGLDDAEEENDAIVRALAAFRQAAS